MQTLTRYPEGSIRELWSISLPLMISALATLCMLFTDRIFLAHYSVAALNASVNAGTLSWALMAGVGMVTAMSEVFIAQYNGSKQYRKLGVPAWQMVWFSLFSYALFIPLALFGAPFIFQGAALETEYFQILMLYGPSYAIMMAFSGFFIGRGKTKLLIWLAIAANIINIALDWMLIFGIPGLVPEMGIRGAALATCFGYFFEASVLAYLFLKKENREQFGTNCWQLNWDEMKKCCTIGIPQGVFCFLEIFGLAVFYWMMTSLGEKHITISSICQSFAILLSFFSDGLSRGAAAVAGNFMGAKRPDLVHKVLRAGVSLLAIFSLAIGAILIIDPVDVVRLLFTDNFDGSLKICMAFAFAYIVFDGVRWLFSGLLVAAGDTRFLLVAGSVSVWLFLLIPCYLIVVRNSLAVEYAWGLMALYSTVFLAVYWARFARGAWKKIDIIAERSREYTLAQETDSTDPDQRSPDNH